MLCAELCGRQRNRWRRVGFRFGCDVNQPEVMAVPGAAEIIVVEELECGNFCSGAS